MKKLAITIAIVLGLGLTTYANPKDGGLFSRGNSEENAGQGYFSGGGLHFHNRDEQPILPLHELQDNQDADAPLGAGIALLMGLGGAYLVAKKRREEE
jgi:hypothetical protein